MATLIRNATKDSIIRDDNATNRGSGQDPHNTAGLIGGEEDRTLIDFETVPNNLGTLTYARLYMRRSTGSPPTGHDTPDNGAQLIPGRITGTWSEGGKGADHLYSTANAVKWPGPSVTGELSARGSQPSSGWWFIDVTEIVQQWVNNANSQQGIRLRGATNADIVFDSVQGATSNKPYLDISYGSGGTGGGSNQAPNAPTNLAVTYGADGRSFTLSAKYTDPNADTSSKYEVMFTPDAA